MAAKIYSGIKGIECPDITFDDYHKSTAKEKENEYLAKLKEQCTKNQGKSVGEIIKFQVADGYARYMVYSEKPLQLIHINLDDGYQSEFAELLTLTKVKELIARERKLKEFFTKYKK